MIRQMVIIKLINLNEPVRFCFQNYMYVLSDNFIKKVNKKKITHLFDIRGNQTYG